MDYKEKYEQLAKFIKDLYPFLSDYCKEKAEGMLPELKESEDERIRKEIISFLKEGKPYYRPNSIRRQEWWAWLEKQGEHKPADKVEPKFKVGDWVVRDYDNSYATNRVIKVEQIDDETFGYTLDNEAYFSGYWENSYRLWTIKDAKDGDVLATDNNSICVFDGTVEDGKYPFAYCGLTGHHGFEVYDMKHPFTHNDVHPATKEQRDILFAKMQEAGYEWSDKDRKLIKMK